MTVLLAKVRSDLRLHPGRAALVALTILLAAGAVSGAFVARDLLGRGIAESYAAALPPQAIIVTGEDTDRALQLISTLPEVVGVEPRRVLRGRVQGADGHWASLRLTILPELEHQEVSRIVPLGEESGGLLVERSGLEMWAGSVGQPMTMRLSGGREVTLPTVGLAADGAVAPGVQDHIVYAYANTETAQEYGLPGTFDELHVRLAADAAETGSVISAIIERLNSEAVFPARIERVLQRHPHADQMTAVLMLLTVFAGAALLAAGALVTNLTATVMRAERPQVGIARALGATRVRVAGTAVMTFGLAAMPAAIVGAVLGAGAGQRFATWAAHELNLLDGDLAPRTVLLGLAALVGAGLPLILAWIAAWRAASVLPLAAIYPEREAAPSAPSRLLAGRPMSAWVARATLARPLRLALVLLALALGGTALMSAANIYQSLAAAVERSFAARSDDLDIRLLAPVPVAELEAAVHDAGVEYAEVWGGLLVSVSDSMGQQSGSRFGLLAPPHDTRLLHLPVADGRWLGEPSDMEFVASRNLLAREPSLRLGEEVTLAHGLIRVTARLVGVTEEATEPGVYATQAVHDALASTPGLGGALRIVTSGDPEVVSDRLEDRLFRAGAVPALAFERAELIVATTAHFVILLVLLGTVAGVALLVGALGLTSSIAASVLERGREVAMIRAMGGSDRRLMALFVGESVAVAVLAFVLALVLSLPFSAALAAMLGGSMLHIAIPLQISTAAVLLWALMVVALSVIAAAWPLRKLLRLPPATALAYE